MTILSLVTHRFPAAWRRKARCVIADLTRDALTPPDRLIRIFGDDILTFRQIGRNWREAFIREAGLRPDERILDVGAGCGRTAVALTSIVGETGSYEGMEIVEPAVRWWHELHTLESSISINDWWRGEPGAQRYKRAMPYARWHRFTSRVKRRLPGLSRKRS